MLPGLRKKLAGARRVAMRQVLVQRLRRIAGRPDGLLANQLFDEILSRTAGNTDAKALLESATLRAARDAEAGRDWPLACRFWVWNAAVAADTKKASRNLSRCARTITSGRNDRKSVTDALNAWRFLISIDSESQEGPQGVAWCSAWLARAAEQVGDFATARSHWSAVLEVLPNDEAALEGLRKAVESGVTVGPAAGLHQTARWHELQKHLTRTARPDYRSQFAAGRSLLTAGAPELAVPFLEQALRHRKASEAALLLGRSRLMLGQYDAAAATLPLLSANGDLSSVQPQEMRSILTHAAQDVLPDALLSAICMCFSNAPQVVGAAMPLLVTRRLRVQILELVDRIEDDSGEWSVATVLDVASYLAEMGESERALRLLGLFSGAPAIGAAFLTCAEKFEPPLVQEVLFKGAPASSSRLGSCLAMAEYFLRKDSLKCSAEFLLQLSDPKVDSVSFRQRNKARLARLLGSLLDTQRDSETHDGLARLVAGWVSENVKIFFSAPDFADNCAELMAAAHLANAPVDQRIGKLREHYFAHHLERRSGEDPEAFSANFGSCENVLGYFRTMAELRSVELVPVSEELRRVLTTDCLPLGSGRSADLMTSFAIFRQKPNIDFKSPVAFERAVAWYVTDFMAANNIPSASLDPDVLTYFNEVLQDHPAFGVKVTRFLRLLWSAKPAAKAQYDLSNGLDALLFLLEALADQLPTHPHYRAFFAAALHISHPEQLTLFDACILAMSDPLRTARNSGAALSRLLALQAPTSGSGVTAESDSLRDVLLIGHGGNGTGLSRNFTMLSRALDQNQIRLATLSYELQPKRFAEELKAWRERCRSQPVVIAAVNAQDVPMLFVRDRYDVLDSCHVVGFFLWETSRAPRVQRLGIELVDEVWTPTKYVADVYAAAAPVHVVGKGLFGEGEWPELIRHAHRGITRFLTVFDFHSSIERKNPWASVAAFQKAFPGERAVELIVKASNVNPQHPGNLGGQWEKICAAAEQDKRIRIVTARYTEEQMQQLMRATSCVVSLHRSEGFGYVLADALAHGVPVVATAYSGNIDFCGADTSFPVAYRLLPVNAHGAHWEEEGAEWAEADIDSAVAQMRRVHEDYPEALRKAALGREAILSRYSMKAFAATLRTRLDAIQ
jgi:glycosyltransferase involved in cell wall biosynthesis